jgi:hypothetical protein
MVLAKRVDKAREAEGILTNPVVADAFAKVEAAYTLAWRQSPAADSEAREKCYFALNALIDVKAEIARAIRDGRVADLEIQDLETERVKEMING